MNEVLQFARDFAGLFNAALILALAAIVFKVFDGTLKRKDAELDLLKEQIATMNIFSVEKVTERFRALKEYYECHLNEWHESSMRALEEEKSKAIEQKQNEFEKRIQQEIDKRNGLIETYLHNAEGQFASQTRISLEDACGLYFVTGHNPAGCNPLALQSRLQSSYVGELHSLAFVFVADAASTRGPGATETGIVLYEFLAPAVLRGFWTAFRTGEPASGAARWLGFEEIRKAGSEATTS